jgi:3-keto-disaccharide hydrolase
MKFEPMNLRNVLLAGGILWCATVGWAAPNELTPSERAEGWKLLFNGKTTAGWRSFKKQTFPQKGWVVEEGCLKKMANVQGGDIITTNTFNDFDLRWEWRLAPKANNGIKYFITEERGEAIGHEYQMIDESPAGPNKHSTASFYEVLPPNEGSQAKPAGEWNESRVLVQGNHVEHWLNGAKVLEYELGSEQVKAGVASSKFKNVKGFGEKLKGHILLTDHKDEAWFRDIKIRELR